MIDDINFTKYSKNKIFKNLYKSNQIYDEIEETDRFTIVPIDSLDNLKLSVQDDSSDIGIYIDDDFNLDQSLRPSSFNEFIGQNEVIENLKLYIDASQKRSESLDHVLLFGPPGLGKTTLAQIISKESVSYTRLTLPTIYSV